LFKKVYIDGCTSDKRSGKESLVESRNFKIARDAREFDKGRFPLVWETKTLKLQHR
jgi:hypothetical protein